MSNVLYTKEQEYEYVIDVRLTDVCNYTCWYCDKLSNTGYTEPHNLTDVSYYNKLVDHIRIRYPDMPIRFHLYGGEPTLAPMFGEVVDGIYKDCVIGVSTNLSTIVPEMFNDNVELYATYHKNQVNLNTFIQNALIVKDKLKVIPIMYTEDFDEDDYKRLFEIFGSELLWLYPVIIHTDIHNPEVIEVKYDGELINRSDMFQKNGNYAGSPVSLYDMLRLGRNFKGCVCDTLKHKLSIDHKGDIYPCFIDSLIGNTPICHITNITELKFEDIICRANHCYLDICDVGCIKDCDERTSDRL